MSARIFFGPPGELLGDGSDGVPVTGSESGVEPMVEITTLVTDFRLEDAATHE